MEYSTFNDFGGREVRMNPNSFAVVAYLFMISLGITNTSVPVLRIVLTPCRSGSYNSRLIQTSLFEDNSSRKSWELVTFVGTLIWSGSVEDYFCIHPLFRKKRYKEPGPLRPST